MNIRPEDITNDSDYERVPADELPVPVVFRHRVTRNCVFFAHNRKGKLVVMDRYVVLRDIDGELVYGVRENGNFFRNFDGVFNTIALVLNFASDSRVHALLNFAGRLDIVEKIKEHISDVHEKLTDEKLQALLNSIGHEDFQIVYNSLKDAFKDGVFTVDERKAIEAIAFNFQF